MAFAKEIYFAFDCREKISKYLNRSKARRVNTELGRVNIDFAVWFISSLDNDARRLDNLVPGTFYNSAID